MYTHNVRVQRNTKVPTQKRLLCSLPCILLLFKYYTRLKYVLSSASQCAAVCTIHDVDGIFAGGEKVMGRESERESR